MNTFQYLPRHAWQLGNGHHTSHGAGSFPFILLPRSSITVLPKPAFYVVLPNIAVLIALLPNFGAVLTVEAKAVSGPESDDNCYSEYEDRLHFSGPAGGGCCSVILNPEC
jgi:hypothetical protein